MLAELKQFIRHLNRILFIVISGFISMTVRFTKPEYVNFYPCRNVWKEKNDFVTNP